MPPELPHIAVITPGLASHGDAVHERAAALYDLGMRMLVLREPQMNAQSQARLHEALKARCPELRLVHHSKCPGTLRLSKSEPVWVHKSSAHLQSGVGSKGESPFGASIHNAQELRLACEQGASYVFLAPIWSPNSKPNDTRAPLGPAQLDAMQANSEIPVFGLGGVNAQRCATWAGRGEGRVALIGRLFSGDWDEAKSDYLALAKVLRSPKS